MCKCVRKFGVNVKKCNKFEKFNEIFITLGKASNFIKI